MLEVGERPWGKYYVLEDEENYKLKRIEVNAGHRLSYQYHHHRQEFWTVVQGEAVVVLDGEEREMADMGSTSKSVNVHARVDEPLPLLYSM